MSPGEQGFSTGENGTQRKKSSGVESANSHLLTREENAVAFRLLGPRCQSLATAVVQIYQSEPQSNHNRWNKRSCGVVCFVKDNNRRYEIKYSIDRSNARGVSFNDNKMIRLLPWIVCLF